MSLSRENYFHQWLCSIWSSGPVCITWPEFPPTAVQYTGQKALSTRKRINEYLYNFNTALYQVLETGPSDRTNIGSNQLLKCLYFSLYPFSLYLNSPFNVWYYFCKRPILKQKIEIEDLGNSPCLPWYLPEK